MLYLLYKYVHINDLINVWIFWRLREKQVIVAVEGKYRNVVYIIPPLCFSKHNANTFIEALDDVVNDLVKEEILEKVKLHSRRNYVTIYHLITTYTNYLFVKFISFLAFVETRAPFRAG